LIPAIYSAKKRSTNFAAPTTGKYKSRGRRNETDGPNPALGAGTQAIQPRALTAAEAKPLFDIIASLMGTNMALREHAEQLAQFTHNWAEAFKQLRAVGYRIERFANFEHDDGENG
jgi:hypothetical protein